MLPTVTFSRKDEEANQESYKLSDETFDNINEVLKLYIGTKNYHNFTSKKKSNDPSAKRYIMEFSCEKPFVRKNVEFAILKVKGESTLKECRYFNTIFTCRSKFYDASDKKNGWIAYFYHKRIHN